MKIKVYFIELASSEEIVGSELLLSIFRSK